MIYLAKEEAVEWARKEDKRWAAAFELHLVTTYHPPKGLAQQALSEIHETVTEAGRPAEELLGDPRQYAAQLAGPRRARRARRRKTYAAVAFALAIAVANVDALRGLDVTSFWFWIGLVAMVFSVVNAVVLYGDFRRHR
ncbi:hypothetical protein ABZ769_24750 [Streptomyces olivoreticuli]